MKNDAHIETSSAFDINIIEQLYEEGKFKKDNYIICNGLSDHNILKTSSISLKTTLSTPFQLLTTLEKLIIMKKD